MNELKFNLSTRDKALVSLAMLTGAPVIIGGDRTGPTGKSTLCEYINNHGGNAVETWELEDRLKELDRGKNAAYVYVQLDEKLSQSDITPKSGHGFGQEQYVHGQTWRRFELMTDDDGQIDELYALLDRLGLSRRDLALIVASLRIRPGFEFDPSATDGIRYCGRVDDDG